MSRHPRSKRLPPHEPIREIMRDSPPPPPPTRLQRRFGWVAVLYCVGLGTWAATQGRWWQLGLFVLLAATNLVSLRRRSMARREAAHPGDSP